jgi:hypothetical protein
MAKRAPAAIPAGELEARRLKRMDEVAQTRAPLVDEPPAFTLGCMRGTVLTADDDLFSTGEAWMAERA